MSHSKKILGVFAVSGILTCFVSSAVGFADDTLTKGLSFVKRIVEYRNQLNGYKKVASDFASYCKDYHSNDNARNELKVKEQVLKVVLEVKERWNEFCNEMSKLKNQDILEPKRLQSILNIFSEFCRFYRDKYKSNDHLFAHDDYFKCAKSNIVPFCGLLRILRYVEIYLEILDKPEYNEGKKLKSDDEKYGLLQDFLKCDIIDMKDIDGFCKSFKVKVECFTLGKASDEDFSYDEAAREWAETSFIDEALNLEYYKRYLPIINAESGSKTPDLLSKNDWGSKVIRIWNSVEHAVTEMLCDEEKKWRSECEKCQKTINETQLKADEYKRYIDWRRDDGGGFSSGVVQEPLRFIKDLLRDKSFISVLNELGLSRLVRAADTRDYLYEHVEELLVLRKLLYNPEEAKKELLEQFKFNHVLSPNYNMHY